MSTTCDIRVQAWGRSAVLVCLTCGDPDTAGLLLVRAEDAGGLSVYEVEDRTAKHRENIRRENAEGYAGAQVEGQTDFGISEDPTATRPDSPSTPPDFGARADFVAYGEPDDYRAPGVSRTGQVLRGDGGPSLREYLESKGEL